MDSKEEPIVIVVEDGGWHLEGTGRGDDCDKADRDEAGLNATEPAQTNDDQSSSAVVLPSVDPVQAEMNRSFHARRRYIIRKHPRITELKHTCPNLFHVGQILREFERITNRDIDTGLASFFDQNSHKIINIAKGLQNPIVTEILQKAEQKKEENPNYKEYWNMFASLCILPVLLGEESRDLVMEVAEQARVDPVGLVVPTLVSRGEVYNSSHFVLVIEQERVATLTEFTLAFSHLFASFWVFNMLFPTELSKTLTFVQKVIIGIKDSFPVPQECIELKQQLDDYREVQMDC